MVKVRIDKADKETFWYSSKIGQEFNVEQWCGCSEWYRCTFDAKGILKSDCTVISSDTQPEQWVPQVGEWAYIVKYEYFDNHTGMKEGTVFRINQIENGSSINGVWLKPQGKSGIASDHCRKALPHEIPAPEPKLIAKAGEWVKIVDFGTFAGDSDFSINKSYELGVDMYSNSNFEVTKDDACEMHCIKLDEIKKYGMKFEKCETPTEEKTEIKKPPIGLMPEWRHKELRIKDTLEAIKRFREHNICAPKEWHEELIDLLCSENFEVKLSVTKTIE